MNNRPMWLTLLCILALEVVLFSWTLPAFFGSDSIFFFARRIEQPAQILQAFTSLDDRGNYRPLTLALFSFVLYPLFKFNYVGYHLVPILFHLLNTVLVFKVFRRLLQHRMAILAATAYFGLNSINFFITYSITFLPDFTYAFFYLCSLVCYLRFDEDRKVRWLILSLAGFILSLLCKEAAATLPAVLLICIAVRAANRKLAGGSPSGLGSLSPLVPYVLLTVVYVGFFTSMKGGTLYSRNPDDPYRASFSLSTLSTKSQYVWWAMDLPSGVGQLKGHPRVMNLLSKVVPGRLMTYIGDVSDLFVIPTRFLGFLLVLPIIFVLFRALLFWRREPIIIGGLFWFLIALSPVMFLAVKTMRHNLYVPLIGLAAVMGAAVREAYVRIAGWRPRPAVAGLACLIVAYFSANALAVKNNLVDSWPAISSLVAESSLEDMRKAHPALPPSSTLFFLDNRTDDLVFYFEGGNLFRIFCENPTLRCLFEQRGDKLPSSWLTDPRTFLFYYYGQHLYDITGQCRSDALDATSYKLLDHFSATVVSFDENEPYPLKGYFGTPGNNPAFLYRFASGGDCREAVVTVAGAAVRFVIPRVTVGSLLAFGTAMVHERGDGAEGRIWLECNGKRELIFKTYLNPARNPDDRRWLDRKVDIGAYAGQPVTLSFECSSGESRNTAADWFGWSIMKIQERPRSPSEN